MERKVLIEKEIYSRIDKFVFEVLQFIRLLPKELISYEISKQLIRSSTSIGANAREGQASQTRKEFIRCFSISKRESRETWYWLSLLLKLFPRYKTKMDFLIDENEQLTAIISSIILSTKKTI